MSSKRNKQITESQARELAEDAEEIELTPEEVELNLRTAEFVEVVPDDAVGLPEVFMIGNTKHYRNGNYEVYDEMYKDLLIKGNKYEFYDIVGAQYHQLKGKLYNLIESIGVSDKQEKALKGLIKDFCNSKYKNTIGDLEGWMDRMGFRIMAGQSTMKADPLGDREESN